MNQLFTFKYFILGLLLAASGTNLNGQYEMDCDIENTVFGHQEELVYKIYYNLDFLWIPAGEVHFTIQTNEEHYVIEAVGQTYSSYEWFYKVKDFYKSVIDKETLLPVTAERSVKEGGYRLYEYLTFDHGASQVHVTRGRSKETATDRGTFDFDDCTSDLLSLFFRLRNVDRDAFVQAGSMPLNFFLDMEQYRIPMRFVKTERKRIRGLGRFNTIKVSPSVLGGNVFKDGSELVAWVSDDPNRIPLMIESPLSVGSAKAVLKSHKETKLPLLSKS